MQLQLPESIQNSCVLKSFVWWIGGVVDGELLSNAFSEYQSQYATDAMDEVYEKLATIWENLKSKLEELDDLLQREDLHSPDANAFNKAQAFKWGKGYGCLQQSKSGVPLAPH